MSCDRETAEILRQAGHKLTPQRMLIVRALRHAGGHMSAPQLADAVKADFPAMDVSTVYRTLDVLKRMRMVTSTDMGSGDAVFEWAAEGPHHHLVCTACGAAIEFDHEYLEELNKAISTDFGFQADMHHFAIFGLCRECKVEEELG